MPDIIVSRRTNQFALSFRLDAPVVLAAGDNNIVVPGGLLLRPAGLIAGYAFTRMSRGIPDVPALSLGAGLQVSARATGAAGTIRLKLFTGPPTPAVPIATFTLSTPSVTDYGHNNDSIFQIDVNQLANSPDDSYFTYTASVAGITLQDLFLCVS